MKTIKELEKEIEELENKSWFRCHVGETKEKWLKSKAQLQTLKDVVELIENLNHYTDYGGDPNNYIKTEEFKQRITGEVK